MYSTVTAVMMARRTLYSKSVRGDAGTLQSHSTVHYLHAAQLQDLRFSPSAVIAEYPEAWIKAAEKQMKGKKVESLERKTPEGIVLKPLYNSSDLGRCEALADSNHDAPGLFPYHR